MMDNQPELAGRSRMSARSLGSEQGRGRPLPIGRALPNTKTAPTGLQLVSSPPGETRPADRTACSPHLRSVRAVAIGTLAQRAWQRPPGRLRLEAATFSGGIAVLGGGPENALQPRHARPQQEFLRNNARSDAPAFPHPPPRGRFDGRNSLRHGDFPAAAGNQGDKVKQIDNAVPLDVAKALVLAPLGAA